MKGYAQRSLPQLLSHFQRGEGTPRIWLHGVFGNGLNLYNLSKKIPGRHVFLDARNHGKSFKHSDTSYRAMSEDILRVMDHLNIEKASLVGHSMGGKTSIAFACLFPDRVNEIVALDIAPIDYSIYQYDYVIENLYRLSYLSSLKLQGKKRDQIVQDLMATFRDKKVVELFNMNLDEKDQGEWSWKIGLKELKRGYKAIAGFDSSLGPFEGKALAILAGNSYHTVKSHALANGTQLYDLFQPYLPNVEYCIVSETSHWLHVEKPNEVSKRIKDFLTN